MTMKFGHTDDRAELDAVHAYRQAAIDDGWSCEPTYPGGEDMTSAARLTRDGFVMSILSRDNTGKGYRKRYECDVSIWGPDKLSLIPPQAYDFEKIKAGLGVCGHCKQPVE